MVGPGSWTWTRGGTRHPGRNPPWTEGLGTQKEDILPPPHPRLRLNLPTTLRLYPIVCRAVRVVDHGSPWNYSRPRKGTSQCSPPTRSGDPPFPTVGLRLPVSTIVTFDPSPTPKTVVCLSDSGTRHRIRTRLYQRSGRLPPKTRTSRVHPEPRVSAPPSTTPSSGPASSTQTGTGKTRDPPTVPNPRGTDRGREEEDPRRGISCRRIARRLDICPTTTQGRRSPTSEDSMTSILGPRQYEGANRRDRTGLQGFHPTVGDPGVEPSSETLRRLSDDTGPEETPRTVCVPPVHRPLPLKFTRGDESPTIYDIFRWDRGTQ